MKKNPKRWLQPIAGVVIALLILVTAIKALNYRNIRELIIKRMFGNETSNVLTEASSSLVEKTSGWKTYRNTKYGYEIKYPSDWEYEEVPHYLLYKSEAPSLHEELQKISFSQTEYEMWQGKISISISPNNKQLSLDLWAKQYEEQTGEITGVSDFTLGGRQAKKFSIFGGDCTIINIATIDKAHAIVIEYEEQAQSIVDSKKFLPICNKIISTLKFIN